MHLSGELHMSHLDTARNLENKAAAEIFYPSENHSDIRTQIAKLNRNPGELKKIADAMANDQGYANKLGIDINIDRDKAGNPPAIDFENHEGTRSSDRLFRGGGGMRIDVLSVADEASAISMSKAISHGDFK